MGCFPVGSLISFTVTGCGGAGGISTFADLPDDTFGAFIGITPPTDVAPIPQLLAGFPLFQPCIVVPPPGEKIGPIGFISPNPS